MLESEINETINMIINDLETIRDYQPYLQREMLFSLLKTTHHRTQLLNSLFAELRQSQPNLNI
jgi:hypothetical protein